MAARTARVVFVTDDEFVILEGDFIGVRLGDRYVGGAGPAIDQVEVTIETIFCTVAVASIAELRGRVQARDLPDWTLHLADNPARLVRRSAA